jgi:regulator of replication initiation timing
MNKQEILNIVNAKITDKIRSFENLIAETRASNNDTKSSMGDKYETGREMLQQEINNLQRQLNETLNQQAVLQKITADPSEKVQNGALVKTNKGLFYISASLGEIISEKRRS